MNERIKELMEQCETEYSTSHEPCYDMEKFAELIVRECAAVIERNLFQDIGWNTSRAVKRHFGIEVEE
jgi:hypothetical protein